MKKSWVIYGLICVILVLVGIIGVQTHKNYKAQKLIQTIPQTINMQTKKPVIYSLQISIRDIKGNVLPENAVASKVKKIKGIQSINRLSRNTYECFYDGRHTTSKKIMNDLFLYGLEGKIATKNSGLQVLEYNINYLPSGR
jgi:hypothetical protein